MDTNNISAALDRINESCSAIDKISRALDGRLRPGTCPAVKLIDLLIKELRVLIDTVKKERDRVEKHKSFLQEEEILLEALIKKQQEFNEKQQALSERMQKLVDEQERTNRQHNELNLEGQRIHSQQESIISSIQQKLDGMQLGEGKKEISADIEEIKKMMVALQSNAAAERESGQSILFRLGELTALCTQAMAQNATSEALNSERFQEIKQLLPAPESWQEAFNNMRITQETMTRASRNSQLNRQYAGSILIPAKRASEGSTGSGVTKKLALGNNKDTPIDIEDGPSNLQAPSQLISGSRTSVFTTASASTIEGAMLNQIIFSNWGGRENAVKAYVLALVNKLRERLKSTNLNIQDQAQLAIRALERMAVEQPPGKHCPIDWLENGAKQGEVEDPKSRQACRHCSRKTRGESVFCARVAKRSFAGDRSILVLIPRDIAIG